MVKPLLPGLSGNWPTGRKKKQTASLSSLEHVRRGSLWGTAGTLREPRMHAALLSFAFISPRFCYSRGRWLTAIFKSTEAHIHTTVSPFSLSGRLGTGQGRSAVRVGGKDHGGFTASPTTVRSLSLQLESREAPVAFQLKLIHWDHRGEAADPLWAWRPSRPHSGGDQGHIYRDLQRTVLHAWQLYHPSREFTSRRRERLTSSVSTQSKRSRLAERAGRLYACYRVLTLKLFPVLLHDSHKVQCLFIRPTQTIYIIVRLKEMINDFQFLQNKYWHSK